MFRSQLRSVAWAVSTLDSLLILYLTLVRPKLESASTVWNFLTCTDAKKPERIQRKFTALCQYRFFTHNHATYEVFLKFLNFHTLQNKRLYLDALVFVYVYSGLKCCPSLLATTGIRVLPRNFRNSSLFTATCNNSPSAGYVSAANRLFKDVDIFRKPITSLKQILRWLLYPITLIYIDEISLLWLFCGCWTRIWY